MAETWVFNEVPSLTGNATAWPVNFVSNGKAFTELTKTTRNIRYKETTLATIVVVYTVSTAAWSDENYRTVTFEEAPSGTLLEWLTVAATKVPAKHINRVDLNGETVLDLTADTVTPETLLVGTTAHNAKGETITGTLAPCTVYSAENPKTLGDDYGYFTWTIPAADHGFSSNKIVVSIYKSTGEQVLCDVKVSPTDYSVTVGLYYDTGISTYAVPSAINVPAGEFRAVIIGPVETPAAAQQAMLNQLPVYTGGGNY